VSTTKIYLFVGIMTVVVATLLTGLRNLTAGQAEINEKVFNKRAILKSLADGLDGDLDVMTDEEVQAVFNDNVQQYVVKLNGTVVEDMVAEDIKMKKEVKKADGDRNLPLFVYSNPTSGKTYYITAVRGKGLWDEIWGSIALEEDFKTIAGVSFDHAAETPGLGAEIKDNAAWVSQFTGKSIYNDAGEFVSILVRKGGAIPGNPHQVDAITGATITGDGVTKMLEKGLVQYEPYFATLRASN
jgi:Na+-transporting NADH:ubiquinone oxidoreductase subunit C